MKDKSIKVEDIIINGNGKLIIGDKDIILEEFCTDTRKVKEGDVYVGIKGDKYNGNYFYEDALNKGAKVCILQDVIISNDIKEKYKDRVIVIVNDTIETLQRLATYKRQMFNIPVVAITGSVGKTSTKDIIASVMSKKFNVLKTEGNYNSQLGVALTVLKLKKNHTAMVIELGMNNFGEISKLTKIVRPNIAVITNIGTAHIGNLGSRENILKAKLEILEGLQSDGKIVINNDNDILYNWNLEHGKDYDVVTYGINEISDFMAHDIELSEDGSKYNINIQGKNYHICVKVGGNHFVSNSLCSIAVGKFFSIDMEDIIQGILKFELTKRRMQIEKLHNGSILINDCYNANMDSMKAAIDYLSKLKNIMKVAVLGDMLELGKYSEILHKEVGKEIEKCKIDVLITVGKEAEYIAEEARKQGMDNNNIYIYNKNTEAIEKLEELIMNKNCAILVKASNGMNFQEIVDQICKY